MNVLGLAGWSGSGKTTLLTALLPLFVARGLTVSTIKHAHHEFDLDQPGKDSWRHRQAGAREVMIAGGARWALLHEADPRRRGEEPGLEALLARLSPVDLVLVEGFKSSPHPKIEVYRPSLGQPPLWPGRADVVAVASDADQAGDAALAGCGRVVLALDRPDGIVDWAVRRFENAAAHTAELE